MKVVQRTWAGWGVMAVVTFAMAGDGAAQHLHSSCPRPGRWATSARTISARGIASYLANPRLEGRAFGSHGELCASGFIADLFQRVGLSPISSDGFFQVVPSQHAGRRPRNVVAVLPGADETLRSEYIVVGAHHDHIGVRDGRVHPGADDNASGVATLLLVARELARGDSLGRSVLFVTFSGEEAGFQGSRHFLSVPPVPLESINVMINLDMVGRLASGGLAVRGWDELPPGFEGRLGMTEARLHPRGTRLLPGDGDRFRGAGVPVIAFFTGTHPEYHRTTDTADKLDLSGMNRIARLVAQLVREF